jgi:hypothetical protein
VTGDGALEGLVGGTDVSGVLAIGGADGGADSGAAPQAETVRVLAKTTRSSPRDDFDITTYDASREAPCQPATGVGYRFAT